MNLKEIIKNIRLRINKIGASKRKEKLKTTDFSIISNNCYAGIIYQYLGLQYNTPTIGLYFYPSEYIKFVENFEYYIKQNLKFMQTKDSKHYEDLCKHRYENKIIGKLDDIEIVFLHYASEEEALEKWNKRCKRLSKNIIFKFNDQNGCTYEDIEKFDKLDIDKKICFTAQKYDKLKSTVWIKKYRNRDCVKEDYYSGHKYFNIIDYVNNITEENSDNLYQQYKYSIIIPVYNVELYLEECINSIINQTYNNYEIILVNDGSTDRSKEICDRYSNEYEKINVIHQKNGGLSNARNTGIKNAVGDYIIFLDSDDFWIDNRGLNKINDKLNKNKANILLFNVAKLYNDGRIVKDNRKEKYEEITIEKMIQMNLFKASANNKVINKKLVDENTLRFSEGLLSEDIEWCGKLLEYESKMTYLNETIYAYRQRSGSITHSKDKKHIFDILYQCEKMLDRELPSDKENIILSFYAYEYCTAIGIYTLNVKDDEEIKEKILNNIALLKYNLSDKVKKVNFIFKIFHNRLAFIIIKVFMKFKN